MTWLPFNRGLEKARFIERPNRFILHVQLQTGEITRAHLPDPGRLKELLTPGRSLWLEPASDSNRKTRWTAVLCETEDEKPLVSLQTTLANHLVGQALKERVLNEFKDWRLVRREYKVGASRFDFLMKHETLSEQMLLEVKSVTLAENGKGRFPDAVTARGTKHVEELTALAKNGEWRTAILFVAQRSDSTSIEPAADIDPIFAARLREAKEGGVLLFGRRTELSTAGIKLGEPCPVHPFPTESRH
ncbi:DNA/RNA nuclease SfsA [Shouchella shacheensis]|uniref:DNA/RNA nuclease SfsA n=1 Tax=Shouchella shacheensis TaxID=1649580 RepID=UPI000740266C|nr:DNA/RNA nuclease SfsA [Shouchella shacheensis]